MFKMEIYRVKQKSIQNTSFRSYTLSLAKEFISWAHVLRWIAVNYHSNMDVIYSTEENIPSIWDFICILGIYHLGLCKTGSCL